MTLLESVRVATRLKHYSIRTEQAYVAWAKRFINFHNIGIRVIWFRMK